MFRCSGVSSLWTWKSPGWIIRAKNKELIKWSASLWSFKLKDYNSQGAFQPETFTVSEGQRLLLWKNWFWVSSRWSSPILNPLYLFHTSDWLLLYSVQQRLMGFVVFRVLNQTDRTWFLKLIEINWDLPEASSVSLNSVCVVLTDQTDVFRFVNRTFFRGAGLLNFGPHEKMMDR